MTNKDKLQKDLEKYSKLLTDIYENIPKANEKKSSKSSKKNNDIYLNYTPSEKSLEEKISEAKDESHAALEESKLALNAANEALNKAKEAQSKAETVKWIMIALIVLLVIEFSSRIYTAIYWVQDAISNFYEKAEDVENMSSEFDMEFKLIHKDIDSLHDYVDNKIDSAINKSMLEFYKTQWELKK